MSYQFIFILINNDTHDAWFVYLIVRNVLKHFTCAPFVNTSKLSAQHFHTKITICSQDSCFQNKNILLKNPKHNLLRQFSFTNRSIIVAQQSSWNNSPNILKVFILQNYLFVCNKAEWESAAKCMQALKQWNVKMSFIISVQAIALKRCNLEISL